MRHFNQRIILSLLLLSQASIATAERWYSLGDYIDEEGTNDLAGYAVANSQDGKVIVIGAPHYSPAEEKGTPFKGSKYAGRVIVYTLDSKTDTWSKLGSEIVGDNGEELGTSVDILDDGETIIVGTKDSDGDKRDAGSVKVFELNKSGEEIKWVRKGQTIFGEHPYDECGASVAIADRSKILAFGCPGHDEENMIGVGEVRVFEFDDLTDKWLPIDNAPSMKGEHANGRFGSSLGVSEVGSLAVGAPFANNSKGVVKMFNYNALDKTWDPEGKEVWGKHPGDKCGTSVAMSRKGEHVIIGSPHWEHDGKKHSGAIIVLKYSSPDSEWFEVGSEIVGEEGDEFGTAVDISDDGTRIAVGSPTSGSMDDKESGHISVYHYKKEETKWTLSDAKIKGKGEFAHQGYSVSVSGDGTEVIAGAPMRGYASVYTLASTAPPTMAPSTANERKHKGAEHGDHQKKKRGNNGNNTGPTNGFGTFVLVIFIVGVVGASGFFATKGVIYLHQKRKTRTSFQPAPNTDMSCLNEEIVSDGTFA